MNIKMVIFQTPVLLELLILLVGCSPSTTATATQVQGFTATIVRSTETKNPSSFSTAIPTTHVTPTLSAPQHRISVRVVDGQGEFYDRLTGERFVPRGNNYIRIADQVDPSGNPMVYHSTFNTGLYDPSAVDEALGRMEAEGYNVVRVFVQGNCKEACIGDPVQGLAEGYIANVADFLRKADAHHIYVILTTDGEPSTPYYFKLLDTTWSENFGGNNKSYLTGGGVLVAKQFWQDLVAALRAQDAPLDAILAYELRNELFFDADAAPLSFSSGSFTTVNGKTYDMASAEDRQRMLDENLVYWIDQVRSAILERDPTALVSVGFFVPQQPNPARIGDPRLIDTRPVISLSSLDFIDLHPYPGFAFPLAKYVENFGLASIQEKPIIMGEFGAARASYSSEAEAARDLHDWQVESCHYGFDGWLLWTWDSEEQVDFYNGLTGQGLIDQVLAPANRPDPCQAGVFDFFENNLALHASVQASRALRDQPPSGAVDGTNSQWWGAGDFAPQWILIDLGTPQSVASIRLTITQSPAGQTLHQVWIGASASDLYLWHTFEGLTTDGQVLEFKPENPIENVRYIRVNTRQSPSWVGWQEIEVLAP
ncbi:MAG: discoidin domain-containing protein [Acidobacteriaceae bacterium]